MTYFGHMRFKRNISFFCISISTTFALCEGLLSPLTVTNVWQGWSWRMFDKNQLPKRGFLIQYFSQDKYILTICTVQLRSQNLWSIFLRLSFDAKVPFSSAGHVGLQVVQRPLLFYRCYIGQVSFLTAFIRAFFIDRNVWQCFLAVFSLQQNFMKELDVGLNFCRIKSDYLTNVQ